LYTVLLDFDANKSIVKQGNGTYSLKPVIRTIEQAISVVLVKGKLPVGTMAVVEASASGVSYTSNVNDNGDFMVMGLPPGTYKLRSHHHLLLPVVKLM
jgi:hypothetical protein